MTQMAYKRLLLGVLLLILASSCMDSWALGVALQSIKVDLHLSDTQLGLLSGFAFALLYAVMGIPIARWADSGNRITIISLTIALWSAAMALCALATTFVQLLMIRVGLAIGEAGCIPPAHSLIAHHFTRTERPRAVSLYMLGVPLSAVLGYFLSGWLNELYGWRLMYILLGLPGLGLSVLAWVTLKEPRKESGGYSTRFTRVSDSAVEGQTGASMPVRLGMLETWTLLWRNRTFRHLLYCFSVISFFNTGILQWQPTFFIRSYSMGTGQVGTWFAALYGLGGLTGTYFGGRLAGRLAANNERLQLVGMAAGYVIVAAVSTFIYLSPNHYLSFGFVGIATIGSYAANGPLFATIQTLVPDRMRATSIAIMYFFANLIGLGVGLFAVGVLSDWLRPSFGDESLRYALLSFCPGFFWAGWHLWRASKTVAKDVEFSQGDSEVLANKSAFGVPNNQYDTGSSGLPSHAVGSLARVEPKHLST